jgi:hypothetical protein
MDLDELITQMKEHPACAMFQQTPLSWVVYFPDAYTIPGGMTTPRGDDDVASLQLLYRRVDDWWNAQRLKLPAR